MQPSNSDNNTPEPVFPTDQPTPNPEPPTEPAPAQPPVPQPQPAPSQKVAEHALTDAEIALFGAIYESFEKERLLIAHLLCEKHGYPINEPVGFEFNWGTKSVSVYRQTSSGIETTSETPSAPTPSQTT